MTYDLMDLTAARRRDEGRLIRGGRDGTYRQAEDGLIVRVAAAETRRDADREASEKQRALLALACRDAAEQ
ncbi:MAG: hypothetical protein GZ089_11035 [Aromatoleum sp.]|nr:hypothetical protein [Aromatoleum sp.]